MPLAQTDVGASAENRPGDAYAQLLVAPYFTSKSSSVAAWVCRRQWDVAGQVENSITIGRSITASVRDSGARGRGDENRLAARRTNARQVRRVVQTVSGL